MKMKTRGNLCVLLVVLAALFGPAFCWTCGNAPTRPPVRYGPGSHRFKREAYEHQPLINLEETNYHPYANAQPTEQLRFRRNYIHPTYQAPAPQPSKHYF